MMVHDGDDDDDDDDEEMMMMIELPDVILLVQCNKGLSLSQLLTAPEWYQHCEEENSWMILIDDLYWLMIWS